MNPSCHVLLQLWPFSFLFILLFSFPSAPSCLFAFCPASISFSWSVGLVLRRVCLMRPSIELAIHGRRNYFLSHCCNLLTGLPGLLLSPAAFLLGHRPPVPHPLFRNPFPLFGLASTCSHLLPSHWHRDASCLLNPCTDCDHQHLHWVAATSSLLAFTPSEPAGTFLWLLPPSPQPCSFPLRHTHQ